MTKNQRKLVRLMETVGDDKFFELLDTFNGETIYFTPCFNIQARNEAIRKDWNEGKGLTIHELSEKYQMSKSRIYDILPLIEK
ncbi:Mor transcription activator family protein [Pseudobutyrivibrio sp. JW11]|uniref:Mor transcription activator family protein n=1 Tax=Pseudobutyrivibrio sp. JW11 TaxID=1855302 RepID=UPI0008E3FAAB|nr:Mor transcription activator family protein [Pseudobutyrivibrio sp. JW11]SFO27082.1 Mor transcription activator family protein [Pseudobutyrivibrio sp. JW11]